LVEGKGHTNIYSFYLRFHTYESKEMGMEEKFTYNLTWLKMDNHIMKFALSLLQLGANDVKAMHSKGLD
jgi:hypothetical protein